MKTIFSFWGKPAVFWTAQESIFAIVLYMMFVCVLFLCYFGGKEIVKSCRRKLYIRRNKKP